ncbi:MAG: hypothetical protein U0935_12700 [Pirellulales bacterium]
MPGGGMGGPAGPRFGGPRQGDLDDLKRFDPEMYELEVQDRELERKTFELSSQYRTAPADQRTELKSQVQDAVKRHFEVRQKKRQLQLSRLEKELQRMREEMKRRDDAQEEIVGKRLSELLGERGELDF